MIKYKYLCAVALLAMTACSGNDEIQQESTQEPLLQLTATQTYSITGQVKQTRAADGLLTDVTGFYGDEEVRVYFNNVNQTYQVGAADPNDNYKSVLTGGSLRYPSGTSGTTPLYAVYPAVSAVAGFHTVAYDQTGAAAYKASDLMFAKTNVSLANKSVTQHLDFIHQLVKLKLVVRKGDDLSIISKIEMKNVKRIVPITPTAVALTQGTLATDTDGNGDNLLVFNGAIEDGDQHTFVFIFPAQEWSYTPFLEVTADGQPITYTLSKNDWAHGQEYTLTLTVSKVAESVPLNTSVVLTEWEDANIEFSSRMMGE